MDYELGGKGGTNIFGDDWRRHVATIATSAPAVKCHLFKKKIAFTAEAQAAAELHTSTATRP
jgi:hypothetical protein